MAQAEAQPETMDVNNAENAAEIAEAIHKGPADNEVCAACGEAVKDEHGSYAAKYHDGKWYHNNGKCLPDIECADCSQVIDTTKGYIPSGPFHIDCYYNKLGTCTGCEKKFDKSVTPVKDIRVTSKLGNWHQDCFICTRCGKVIEENEYALVQGKQIHSHCA